MSSRPTSLRCQRTMLGALAPSLGQPCPHQRPPRHHVPNTVTSLRHSSVCCSEPGCAVPSLSVHRGARHAVSTPSTAACAVASRMLRDATHHADAANPTGYATPRVPACVAIMTSSLSAHARDKKCHCCVSHTVPLTSTL
ncbi:hypothetical protein E2562_006536 [Oryza meyeriana var. granulata]|uniref:Uncharacterized protein n=1 Tax=Oryza meyeriana var. granulata TaxID=110450 RepID=A0A6G1BSU5_9ORYZ|nr:hypothetical protein E2562_006536 [Oryza meyeriana var. granulata]